VLSGLQLNVVPRHATLVTPFSTSSALHIDDAQLGGVSRLTWMLSAVACAAWSGYGIILHDWPVLASSIWGFATSATILLLTMLRYSEPRLSPKFALTET
jgi:hypothetical protein